MFDKAAHIARMKPSVDKLVAYLASKGISFSPTDGDLENVVLTSKDKEVKISHHSFYRYSGICFIYKDRTDNQVEMVPVTDHMYMNDLMKSIIELRFSINPK